MSELNSLLSDLKITVRPAVTATERQQKFTNTIMPKLPDNIYLFFFRCKSASSDLQFLEF